MSRVEMKPGNVFVVNEKDHFKLIAFMISNNISFTNSATAQNLQSIADELSWQESVAEKESVAQDVSIEDQEKWEESWEESEC